MEEKIKYKLSYAYTEIEKVYVYPIHLDSGFCERSSFSRLDARFAYHVNEAGCRPIFPITTLLSPIEELEVEKHIDILRKIITSRSKPWPLHCKIIDFEKCSEREIFLEICKHVLSPIATTVKVEHNYAEAVRGFPEGKLICGHTGIGDGRMWHGFPDALVNSVTIYSWDDKTDDELEYHSGFEHTSDSDDMDSGRMVSSVTTVEAKKKMTNPFLSQLVAQCVINCFVEKKKPVMPDCNPQC